jgi:hypothetical protein
MRENQARRVLCKCWVAATLVTLGNVGAAQAADGGISPGRADAGANEDEIILIVDDTPPAAPTGPLPLDRLPAPPLHLPPPPLPNIPLGDLPLLLRDPVEQVEGERALLGVRASQIQLSGRVGGRTGIRPMGHTLDDMLRNLVEVVVALDIRPDLPLRLHLDVYARGRAAIGILAPLPHLDSGAPPARYASATRVGNRLTGVAEVGEAYGVLKLERFRITVGRQLFSWSASAVSPLPGLINPPDPRDGLAFPDETSARVPVLALNARGALGAVGLEFLFLPLFAPPRAPFYASDAEAWDFNEGVSSWVATRRSAPGPLETHAETSWPNPDAFQLGEIQPAGGVRAFFSLWHADVAIAALVGHDPTPLLNTTDVLARAAALAADRAKPNTWEVCPAQPCGEAVALSYRRTALLHAETNGTLGPAVVRGTVHLAPMLGEDLARTFHVITADGFLRSTAAWTSGVSVAVESGYGELIQGFVELGYDLVGGVPGGARLARYEAVDQVQPRTHVVHRPSGHVRFQGTVLDDILWRLRTSVAPWPREAALAQRVGYRLSLNQELGFGTELFAGWRGTRGYFLLPTSRAYVDWSYRF